MQRNIKKRPMIVRFNRREARVDSLSKIEGPERVREHQIYQNIRRFDGSSTTILKPQEAR